MTFSQAVRSCLSKFVTFSGRASRSEFWYFVLFVFLAGILVSLFDQIIFGSGVEDDRGFSSILSLVLFLPQISVGVRRLHDTDRSGWWWWLWALPIIGWIILLVWYVSQGTNGSNRFGHDPLDGSTGFGEDGSNYDRSSIPSVPRK